ncbi:hypothetical protein ACQPUY_07785 [Clostridium nigeriense]|uniref:hypothetical protein n=1 Tax=Clostridium nigeriense TaxID=1805470 RepID=UPI003D347C22
MYKYNFVNNDEFKIAYKKCHNKNFLKSNIILIGIITILLFLLISLFFNIFSEDKPSSFPIVIIVLLMLEILLFLISYKQERKRVLNSTSNYEIILSFDDKGVLILQDNIEKHINWSAVRHVIVDSDNLSFTFNVAGFLSNFFYFKFFDAPKDEIINDLKKYTKVKELK